MNQGFTKYIASNGVFKNGLIVLLTHIFVAGFALISMPIYVDILGMEAFSLLTLYWTILAILAGLDLGLKNSATYFITKRIYKVSEVISSSFYVIITFLIFVNIVIVISHLKYSWLTKIDFLVIFASFIIPLNSVLRGVFDAKGMFAKYSILLLIQGAISYLLPLLFIDKDSEIYTIVGVIVLAHFITLLISVFTLKNSFKKNNNKRFFNKQCASQLVKYGGWLFLVNLINPILVRFDRFIIVQKLGVSVLGFYVAPFELITRILIIPMAFMRVLFPVFSKAIVLKQIICVFIIMLIGASIYSSGFFYFAETLLSYWISQDFGDKSSDILKILSIGIFFNIMAQLPFTILQAIGKTKIIAYIHIVESPIYLGLLVFGINAGLSGVATVWSTRVFIDCVILYVITASNVLRKV